MASDCQCAAACMATAAHPQPWRFFTALAGQANCQAPHAANVPGKSVAAMAASSSGGGGGGGGDSGVITGVRLAVAPVAERAVQHPDWTSTA